MDLFNFSEKNQSTSPLAERLRPQAFSEFMGQKEAQKWLAHFQKTRFLSSLILWGPPGTGKTTMARLIMKHFEGSSEECNAIQTGAKDLREMGSKAHEFRLLYQKKTLLFIDEIHRLNRAQQDVLLPFVEAGDLILLGATTENPSYSLNSALMSRCQLILFQRLSEEALKNILLQAFEKMGLHEAEFFTKEAEFALLRFVDGDSRRLLSTLEILKMKAEVRTEKTPITVEDLQEMLSANWTRFDRAGDEHYDVISAFIKSIRGSDPDAGLYYLARMIKGGEDISFIARRLVILASEDVGNADPRALQIAVAAAQAVEMIGLPEAGINLAQAVTYLASAPKSNRSYQAWKKAQEIVDSSGTQPIPLHLRSSKSKVLMEKGWGQGYKYPHDHPKGFVAQDYWPEGLQQTIYEPSSIGFEKNILEYRKWRREDSV